MLCWAETTLELEPLEGLVQGLFQNLVDLIPWTPRLLKAELDGSSETLPL